MRCSEVDSRGSSTHHDIRTDPKMPHSRGEGSLNCDPDRLRGSGRPTRAIGKVFRLGIGHGQRPRSGEGCVFCKVNRCAAPSLAYLEIHLPTVARWTEAMQDEVANIEVRGA